MRVIGHASRLLCVLLVTLTLVKLIYCGQVQFELHNILENESTDSIFHDCFKLAVKRLNESYSPDNEHVFQRLLADNVFISDYNIYYTKSNETRARELANLAFGKASVAGVVGPVLSSSCAAVSETGTKFKKVCFFWYKTLP